ncbi:hypothetical protein HKX48_001352 [Thoreauomyces humboldtii]|nr:hypothetical protein HKX48_001352 [Thoreauomyces humboldtii]
MLSRSYSCPTGLLSPNVAVSKKPRQPPTLLADLATQRRSHIATEHSDDDYASDESLRSDRDACMSDPEEEAERRESLTIQERVRREEDVARRKEMKKLKKKMKAKKKEDGARLEDWVDEDVEGNEDEGAEPVSGTGGRLLRLLNGTRVEAGGMTHDEVLSIADLSKGRKGAVVSSTKPEFQAEARPMMLKHSASLTSASQESSVRYNELPTDWSVKVNISLLSRRPFACATPLSPDDEADCLLNFAHKRISQRTSPQSTSAEETIYTHLYHWAYPPERRSPSQIALLAKVLAKVDGGAHPALKTHEQMELDHFRKSEETWKESFRSLYRTFCKGQIDYFYYINTQFAVLFLRRRRPHPTSAQSTLGQEEEFLAVMSTSSGGLRKQLERDDVDFQAVNATRANVEPVAGETSMPGSKTPPKPADSPITDRSRIDPNKETLPLRFTGTVAVNDLFVFLTAWIEPRTDRRAERLPTLLALGPFLHAALKTAKMFRYSNPKIHIPLVASMRLLQIVKNEKVGYNVKDTTGSQVVEPMHKLQVTGHILPGSMAGLLATLRARQVVDEWRGGNGGQGLLHGTVTTETRTAGVNLAMAAVVAAAVPTTAVGGRPGLTRGNTGIAGGGAASREKQEVVGTVATVMFKGRAVRWT